ncbi:MAG: protein kinase [bacterium]
MLNQTISHYKILEKLGEGGMGVVYKAKDTRLKREVAIKFLPGQIASHSEERERFKIEAQAAAALNHPNISTIHAIEEVDDEVFIVMEYIDGQELKEKIEAGSVPVDEALDIALQIAKGLQAAHKKGIVHRDIKSANIMLTESGQVKIMDFGLAKVRGIAKVTKVGTTLGTAAYMSPEQARGEEVDHRTDLWSLGVVLYEMLSGHLPFEGDYQQAVLYSIMNEDPEPITRIRTDVTAELEQVMLKMLEKDRDLRHYSVEEFLKSLQDVRGKIEGTEYEEKAKVIAVLPFENISPDKETDYFADGLAEELIINLSRLKDVSVVARTTSMQYKDTKKDIKTIGRELAARYIMEGSVRKFQDNLRISVQLIDVARGTQLWAETYKGKLADVFDIQEEVSRQIVDALMLKLTPKEKVVLEKRATLNHEAFDFYLRARDFLYRLTKNNVQIGIQLFQKAIELDPRYAGAYAGLGEAYATLYLYFDKKGDWLDKSIESSLKALMYDATLAEAYAALSLSYYNKDSLDEALEASKKAIELDPNSFIGYWILGRIYHTTDRDREAVDLFKKVVALNPDFYSAYSDLRLVYERLGEKEKHNETLQTQLKVYPRYLLQHPDDARAHMFFAVNLAQVGKTEDAKSEAAKALELNPTDPLMLYNAARFYAQVGEKHLAVDSLKNSVAAGFLEYEWVKRDPDLDGIRNEPGYIKLMKGK